MTLGIGIKSETQTLNATDRRLQRTKNWRQKISCTFLIQHFELKGYRQAGKLFLETV